MIGKDVGKEDKKSNAIVRTLRALNTGLFFFYFFFKLKVASLCSKHTTGNQSNQNHQG